MREEPVDEQNDKSFIFPALYTSVENKKTVSLKVDKLPKTTLSLSCIDDAYFDKNRILSFTSKSILPRLDLQSNSDLYKSKTHQKINLEKQMTPSFCGDNVKNVTDDSGTLEMRNEVVFLDKVHKQGLTCKNLHDSEKGKHSTFFQWLTCGQEVSTSCSFVENTANQSFKNVKIDTTSHSQNSTNITGQTQGAHNVLPPGLWLQQEKTSTKISKKGESMFCDKTDLLFLDNLHGGVRRTVTDTIDDMPVPKSNICRKTTEFQKNTSGQSEIINDAQKLCVKTRDCKRKGRRLKKDAASLFSVLLPTFNEATEALTGDFVFPGSLSVDAAIQSVLQQERGELKTKTSGVSITRFLRDFPESQEMIYTYFWYIIAHIRRVSTEKMLIGRHANLDRVIRGVFPRYKSELLPTAQLERILLSVSRNGKKENEEAALTSACEVESAASASGRASGLFKSTVHGLSSSQFLDVDVDTGKRSVSHHSLRGRRKKRSGRGNMKLMRSFINNASGDLLTQNPKIVERCTEAIDAFTSLLKELSELSEFLRSCFHRLSILFGQAFERLSTEKDSVFNAFVFIVPHVTYYAMVYSFPNDVFAGIFNASLRLNLYRIFYFWCSGLVATYVRTSGWPTPDFSLKSSITAQNEQQTNFAVVSTPLTVDTRCEVLPLHLSMGDSTTNFLLDGHFSTSCTSLPQGNSLVQLSCDTAYELGAKNREESFDSVDVEVANGHHRIVQEFERYVSHVRLLVQELERRTTDMHKEKTGVVALPHTQTNMVSEHNGKEIKLNLSGQGAVLQTDVSGKKEEQNKYGNDRNHLSNGQSNDNSRINLIRDTTCPTKNHSQSLFSACINDQSKKRDAFLSNIHAQHANKKSHTKTQNNNNGVCILSSFPLETAAANVREYIKGEIGYSLLRAPPLPLLDVCTTTTTTTNNNNNSSNTCCDNAKRSSFITINTSAHQQAETQNSSAGGLRMVREPLPLASPFFMHYAKTRLFFKFSKPTDNYERFKHDWSFSVSSPSPVSSTHSSFFSPMTGSCDVVMREKKQLVTRGHNSFNAVASRKNLLCPPHNTEKAINMTVISPSDAQLRPLRFKGLTKEVEKRQLAHERQMDMIAERERRLRQQYYAENQQSTRCVNELLTSCQQASTENMFLRALRKKGLAKSLFANKFKARAKDHKT